MVDPIEVDWECDPDSILSELCTRDLVDVPVHVLREWRDLERPERIEIVEYYKSLSEDVRSDIRRTACMFDLRGGFDGVNAKSNWPYYIAKAAEMGDLNLVRDILELCPGAVDNPGTREDMYWSVPALMRATDVKICTLLLNSGADIEWHHGYSGDITTPLLCAIENGEVDKARLLVERGADLTWRNNTGAALEVAIFGAQFEIAKFLVDAGADVNAVGDGGVTVLMRACCLADASRFVSLLLHGGIHCADIHRTAVYDRFSALHCAASSGDCASAELLLKKCDADRCCNHHDPSLGSLLELRTIAGRSPLDVAHTQEMKELLLRWSNWERRRCALISLYGFGLWRLSNGAGDCNNNYLHPRLPLYVLRVLGDQNLGRVIIEYL